MALTTTTHPTPQHAVDPAKPAPEPTKEQRAEMEKVMNHAGTPPNAPDYDVADECKPGSPAEAMKKAADKAAAEHAKK